MPHGVGSDTDPADTTRLGRDESLVDACRAHGRLEALVQSVLEVTAGLDPDDTLGRVVEAGMRLTGAQYGSLTVRANGQVTSLVRRGPDDADDAGSDGSTFGEPEERSCLDVRIDLCANVFGDLHLSGKPDSSPFTEGDAGLLQAFGSAVGIAIDNARLYEQSEARRRQLEALQDVSTELLAGRDPVRAVQLVADRARELTAADQSFVAVPDPDLPGDEVDDLVITVASGPESASTVGRRIPVGRSSSGAAFRTRTPSRREGLAYDVFDGATGAFGPALIVPLMAADVVVGILVTVRRRGRSSFGAEQLTLMASFADQAALALRLAAAQREKQELSLLAERDRIARDLHDHVIQRLFAAGLALHGTLREADSPAVRDRIDATIDELQATVAEIRTAIFDLHGGSGAAESFPDRLRRTVADLTRESEIATVVRLEGCPDAVDPVLAGHGEAVVRESVSNAVRHSGARRIRVTVEVADRLTVEVEDDGCGADTPSKPSGLANLAARAAEMDGWFEFDSTVGSGTTVRWSAPVAGRSG